MGPDARITKDRGRWYDTKYGMPAIDTYHPAYLLRLTGQDQEKAKWEVFYDLKAAVEKCRELEPGGTNWRHPKSPTCSPCTKTAAKSDEKAGKAQSTHLF